MSIRSVVLIKGTPDTGDELLRRLQRGLEVQAADDGCLGIVVHRSVERPDDYLVEFTWTSVEAHHTWRDLHRTEWRERASLSDVGAESEALGNYELASEVK